MKIAIIGAGMAGLTAARRLTELGHDVEVFEKSRGIGGRMATRRVEDAIIDHGAQTIKPGDTGLMSWMTEDEIGKELIRIEQPTRLFRANGEILPPDPDHAEPQYAYQKGITTLAKHLASKLNHPVKFETKITRITEKNTLVSLIDDQSNVYSPFDAVILTAPAPQAAALLEASQVVGENRIPLLKSASYSSCLSVLLGYSPPAPIAPAYALLSEDRSHPLLWLAFEQEKSAERSSNGGVILVAQLGPEFSAQNYETDESWIVSETLAFLRPLFGDIYDAPKWSQVKQWRYSQPRGHADFAAVNADGGRIVICGDGLRPGNGRIQEAYLSGIEAADLVSKRGS